LTKGTRINRQEVEFVYTFTHHFDEKCIFTVNMSLQTPIEVLIQQARKQQAPAQKELYERYKGAMFAVCRRYIRDESEAEDVFIQAFYKIFIHLADFKGTGSFKGWARRIMVNECLMYLRKQHNLHLTVALTDNEMDVSENQEEDYPYTYDELMGVIDLLPTGYRTVFNLYVLEEYKHREIAEMLGISINTSKSQFILAKKKILDILVKKNKDQKGLKENGR
jgi:RNA polymerase sigma-70 factor (ECF subfamily)